MNTLFWLVCGNGDNFGALMPALVIPRTLEAHAAALPTLGRLL